MEKPNIEYSEYESVVELLKKSDKDTTYLDLMSKEDKTLDTINNVVKYYNDHDFSKNNFVNLSYIETMFRFVDVWNNIIAELYKVRCIMDILPIFTKNDRLIYIGILFVAISLFMFFII